MRVVEGMRADRAYIEKQLTVLALLLEEGIVE